MSLRVRMLAAFGYVLIFALIALEIPLTLNFSRRVDSEVRSEASAGAHAVAAAASGRLTTASALLQLANQQAIRLGGRLLIVDSRGRVLVDTGGSPRGTSYASRPEIASALHGTDTQGERHSDSLRTDLLFTAVPIVDNGRTTGAVRITQSVGAVRHQVRNDVYALLALGGAVLLLGLGLAWALAGSLSRPLRKLAATARRVASGDMQARAKPTGSSEQIELAKAFNDMTERLGRTLDAQQDFVANASHQLRTPLTGLRLRLEAAGMKASDPGLRRDLAAGERETERLAKLLGDLLRLAQDAERPTATRVGLGAAARRAVERWQERAEHDGHELEIADADDIEVEVAAAAGDLDTILDNLIENALNYAEPGTPVRLECGRDPHGTYLAVLDRGRGLADEEAERVFDRFYRGRTTHAVAGTGLGLAIVETLARRWDGRASLLNRPGGGARAEVRFPSLGAAPGGHSTAVLPTVAS